MISSPSKEFQRRLNLARNGGGLLFCGAGFSADCLSFEPEETLGTGAQLLKMFNEELEQDPPFRDLQNAAEALWDKRGDSGMLDLLKGRFTVAEVTSDMADLLRYPWETVYTTNYDDALEIAAHAAGRPSEAINNTDDTGIGSKTMPIIHLHGFVQKWDIHNIRDSCVLGAESYSQLIHVSKWLDRFRRDVDQAQIVVFVGFNAGDLHLNRAIFDLTGLREKAFFINRPTAEADPDVAAAQNRLGTPFYTGRAGFAATIMNLLAQDAPKEPRLASFSKVQPVEPAKSVPAGEQIEDLFLFGKVDAAQMSRDAASRVSDYHVRRAAVDETLGAIESGGRIVLFSGYPCDGKTMLMEDLARRLSGGRPVYKMRQPYENLLNEVAGILHHAPNAALIIENCFDLPVERLESIARQFDGGDGLLILTSRAVAVDASPAGMTMLEGLVSFRRQLVSRLTETEALALSDLADQIAGWRDFRGLDSGARLRFIQTTCEASLPHFLMRLLKSNYVTTLYREEFNKFSLNEKERATVILALYVSHIGENAPVAVLSSAMQIDVGAIIDGLNRHASNDFFQLVRRNGPMIETVPSIGAENILNSLFPDNEIVDAVVPILKNLATYWREPYEQRLFSQMMRFSILSDVVADKTQIDRFFEHNKQEVQIRRMPLFWLQWHMAKCAAGELVQAEKLLKQGYAEAGEFERRTGRHFDRRQLDDRRAKFLMLRARETERSGADLFRDFKEAIELTFKVLKQDDPQHYPFETSAEISDTYLAARHKMVEAHTRILEGQLNQLEDYAKRRITMLPEGYQRNKASDAMNKLATLRQA